RDPLPADQEDVTRLPTSWDGAWGRSTPACPPPPPSKAAQRSGSHARLPSCQQPQHGSRPEQELLVSAVEKPGKKGMNMSGVLIALVVVAVLVLVGLVLSVRVVQPYEKGVLFRLGRVVGVREPGLRLIVPLIEVLR